MYDPSIRLNNNVQYVINTLKTYGYPQQVLDSFQQNIDKILANTKDNNRIDTANQYIDQFLGDKSLALQDLRRLDPAPGKPAPNQQPQKAGNKNKPGKPRMSDDEIDAFLKEELGGNTTDNGTYASAGVPRGGTKTIGYDPNPGNISLAYAMRNAPEQERRTALINKWNQENRSGDNTYASAGIPRGGVVSPATMGEGFDYTRTYDPMSNSMRPNDSYSYYDPSRNAPSGGDGTDLTLTYDPMTGQMVRR